MPRLNKIDDFSLSLSFSLRSLVRSFARSLSFWNFFFYHAYPIYFIPHYTWVKIYVRSIVNNSTTTQQKAGAPHISLLQNYKHCSNVFNVNAIFPTLKLNISEVSFNREFYSLNIVTVDADASLSTSALCLSNAIYLLLPTYCILPVRRSMSFFVVSFSLFRSFSHFIFLFYFISFHFSILSN